MLHSPSHRKTRSGTHKEGGHRHVPLPFFISFNKQGLGVLTSKACPGSIPASHMVAQRVCACSSAAISGPTSLPDTGFAKTFGGVFMNLLLGLVSRRAAGPNGLKRMQQKPLLKGGPMVLGF